MNRPDTARSSRQPQLMFDALILAGGRGSRLGGVDKAVLIVENQRLIDRVVEATRAAGVAQVVVVGPAHEETLADLLVREEPPFSGPLAALGRGLDEIYAPWVMLLAVDLQHPDAVVRQLLDAVISGVGQRAPGQPAVLGVVLTDESGRKQWLASCMNAAVLREAMDQVLREHATLVGIPLSAVFAHLELVSVAADPGSTADIDTPEQLAEAKQQNRKESS